MMYLRVYIIEKVKEYLWQKMTICGTIRIPTREEQEKWGNIITYYLLIAIPIFPLVLAAADVGCLLFILRLAYF